MGKKHMVLEHLEIEHLVIEHLETVSRCGFPASVTFQKRRNVIFKEEPGLERSMLPPRAERYI